MLNMARYVDKFGAHHVHHAHHQNAFHAVSILPKEPERLQAHRVQLKSMRNELHKQKAISTRAVHKELGKIYGVIEKSAAKTTQRHSMLPKRSSLHHAASSGDADKNHAVSPVAGAGTGSSPFQIQ